MKKILYLLSALSLFACNSGSEPKEQDKKEAKSADAKVVQLNEQQLQQTKLSYVKAVKQRMGATIRVNGLIDVPPQNMVSISMPMGGYLKSTKLLPGMHFNKGDVIAVMEDVKYVELQQEYLIAKSKLKLVEKEYERQRELNLSRASSDKTFQQSLEAKESAAVTLKSLAEKLRIIGLDPNALAEQSISRELPVRAPITGFVSAVNVNVGKYVNPTDVLFELVNPDDIHLSLNVFERDVESLFLGQKVIAFSNNHPDRKYPCEIILIGKKVGEERSINVHCHFEKYDNSLVPGTYMNATILGREREVLVLPDDAVVHDGNNHFLFVKETSGAFRMVKAEAGISANGFTEIVSVEGASLENDEFVNQGSYTLWMKLHSVEE